MAPCTNGLKACEMYDNRSTSPVASSTFSLTAALNTAMSFSNALLRLLRVPITSSSWLCPCAGRTIKAASGTENTPAFDADSDQE